MIGSILLQLEAVEYEIEALKENVSEHNYEDDYELVNELEGISDNVEDMISDIEILKNELSKVEIQIYDLQNY